MKKVALLYVWLVLAASLLNASEMVSITKEQLKCLMPKIDRYLKEKSEPVYIILESSCQKGAVRKKENLDFDQLKSLPELTIEVDDSNRSEKEIVEVKDIVSLSKASLLHIKSHAKEWLDSNTSSWEIPKL